jgi:hypothetical protein
MFLTSLSEEVTFATSANYFIRLKVSRVTFDSHYLVIVKQAVARTTALIRDFVHWLQCTYLTWRKISVKMSIRIP